MRKQKSEPRKIDRWNDDDLTFLDNMTKDLLFSSPYELERRLHPEPGLTLLEFILREFEREAKKKLEENGLDSQFLTELWSTLFNTQDSSRLFRALEDNYPSLIWPEQTSRQLQNAAHVGFCVDRLRNDISNGSVEQAVIDMLKLCFAAVSANLHEIIIRGIRAKRAPSLGGKIPKRKRGLGLAIETIFKDQDAFSAWLYFAKTHYGPEKALEVEGYKIFFDIDLQGVHNNEISRADAFKRGKLFEIFQDNDKTLRAITLSTFRQYFSKAKKKIMSK